MDSIRESFRRARILFLSYCSNENPSNDCTHRSQHRSITMISLKACTKIAIAVNQCLVVDPILQEEAASFVR
jgi:hypothetical protein